MTGGEFERPTRIVDVAGQPFDQFDFGYIQKALDETDQERKAAEEAKGQFTDRVRALYPRVLSLLEGRTLIESADESYPHRVSPEVPYLKVGEEITTLRLIEAIRPIVSGPIIHQPYEVKVQQIQNGQARTLFGICPHMVTTFEGKHIQEPKDDIGKIKLHIVERVVDFIEESLRSPIALQYS